MSVLDLPLVAAYRNAANEAASEYTSALENVKSIRQQNDEDSSIHHGALETAFRERFWILIANVNIDDSEFNQVWTLLDSINTLSDNDLCEPGLGFWLIEDLLDSQTISGSRKVFDYLESRRERMTSKHFKQKSLVVLRCCNELLRRLSRAEDTVFCGRVFIYLFQSFPLGDKSSVNLRGEFHIENVTAYDEIQAKSKDAIKPMEIDIEGGLPVQSGVQTPISTQDVDHTSRTARSTPSATKPSKREEQQQLPPDLDELYPVFWSLQSLFSSPTKLFDPQALQQFKDGILSTISCFKYVASRSASTTGPAEVKRGLKRKRSDVSAEEPKMDALAFNPKYLTNRDLFDLEIHDIAFRRHVLVQALILIDFLLSLNPTAKARLADVVSPNRSVLYQFSLTDEDQKWAQSTRANIASYLQQGNGQEGRSYYRMVDMVLSRDKNWARWKAETCPPISRDPISGTLTMEAEKSLQKLSAAANAPLPQPSGANELAFLSHVEQLAALKEKKPVSPSLEDYYKGIEMDDLDLDFATEEERKEIEERKAGKLWRALRSAKGRRFVLCEQIKNGENLKALVDGEQQTETVEGKDGDEVVEVEAEGQTSAETTSIPANKSEG